MFDDPTLIGCSWTTLAGRLDAARTVRRWASIEPDLSDFTNIDDLITAWRDAGRCNQLLLALIRLAAADSTRRDDDALLVLLHLLSGVAWRLVGQLGDLSADITAVVLAELTCQIRTYRLRCWRGSVTATLERQTRRAVLDDLLLRDRHHVEHREVRLHDVDGAGRHRRPIFRAERTVPADDAQEDLDLVDMLLWAVGRGVPVEDLELLLASERRRGTFGSHADERFATERGMTRRTLLRRRARALEALRELAPTYLADVA
jgi:hypothetical protein